MTSDEEKATEWQVIGQYQDEVEAQVVRAFLQSRGIYSVLRDQHTIGLNHLYSNALGGVRLAVLVSEAPRARQLLMEAANRQFELGDADHLTGQACPQCSSMETVLQPPTGRRWALLLLWFLTVPLPILGRDKWHCKKCDHRWRA